jgi:hypothetical protein
MGSKCNELYFAPGAVPALSGGPSENFSEAIKKKLPPLAAFSTIHYARSLFRANCFDGTNVGTGTAVSTELRINRINISLADRLNRAFVYTGTTGSAII